MSETETQQELIAQKELLDRILGDLKKELRNINKQLKVLENKL